MGLGMVETGAAEWGRKWTKIGGGLRNLAIRRAAVNYTLRPVIAVLIPELDPYEGLYDFCFLTLWNRTFI